MARIYAEFLKLLYLISQIDGRSYFCTQKWQLEEQGEWMQPACHKVMAF
jgi:hypothetical protein